MQSIDIHRLPIDQDCESDKEGLGFQLYYVIHT